MAASGVVLAPATVPFAIIRRTNAYVLSNLAIAIWMMEKDGRKMVTTVTTMIHITQIIRGVVGAEDSAEEAAVPGVVQDAGFISNNTRHQVDRCTEEMNLAGRHPLTMTTTPQRPSQPRTRLQPLP